MSKLSDSSGMTLVEAVMALGALGALALVAMQMSHVMSQGQRGTMSSFNFDELTNAIGLLLETPQTCPQQFITVAVKGSSGNPSVTGKGPFNALTVPGFSTLQLNSGSSNPFIPGYQVGQLEFDSLQTLPGQVDAQGNQVVLAVLKLGLTESSLIAPVKSLGQVSLYREFYMLASIVQNTGAVATCYGGRTLAGQDVVTPAIAALPAGMGLVVNPHQFSQASGGSGAVSSQSCPTGLVIGAQGQFTPAKGPSAHQPTAFMSFFPAVNRLAMSASKSASPPSPSGRLIVDSTRSSCQAFGGLSAVSDGVACNFFCLETGAIK